MVLVSLFIAALSGSAPELEPSDALRWQAPPGCPDAEEVGRRLEAYGGAGDESVELSGEILETGDPTVPYAARFTFRWRGRQSERTMDGDDCEALTEAALLLVAAQIDAAPDVVPEPEPALDDAVPEPEPIEVPSSDAPTDEASEPEEPAPGQAAEPDDDEPTVEKSRDPLMGPRIELAAVSSWGVVPKVIFGGQLGLRWRFRRARVGVRGTFWVPLTVSREFEELGLRGATLFLASGSAHGCWQPRRGRWEFPQCAQVEVGGSHARAFGQRTRSAGGPWSTVSAGTGVTVHLQRRWAIGLDAELVVPVRGVEYSIEGRSLFGPAPVGVLLALRLSAALKKSPRNDGR